MTRRLSGALGIAVLAGLVPGVVMAHAELSSSVPADGAILAEAPDEVVLTFDGELDPVGSGMIVTDADGAEVGRGQVDLTVADRTVLRGAVEITGGGTFSVAWTARSIDGHVEHGGITFSVSSGAPDTAMSGPASAIPVVGILLVALALVLVAARRRHAAIRLLPMLLMLTGCVTEDRPASCDAPSVTIQLALTADSLAPNDPGVCRDQQVTLQVTSDVDGVLHIHGYDAAVPATSVVAGQEVTIAFAASRAGQFPIELHLPDNPDGVAVGILTVHEP